MIFMKHPKSGDYWPPYLIERYAALSDFPQSFEDAIAELEENGFEAFYLDESLFGGESDPSFYGRIAQPNPENRFPENPFQELRIPVDSVKSPYFTAKEAAVYLKTTEKGIYGLVERKSLQKCQGSRKLRFTKEMLDEWVLNPPSRSKTRRRSR